MCCGTIVFRQLLTRLIFITIYYNDEFPILYKVMQIAIDQIKMKDNRINYSVTENQYVPLFNSQKQCQNIRHSVEFCKIKLWKLEAPSIKSESVGRNKWRW